MISRIPGRTHTPVRFQGDAEYAQYLQMLRAYSDKTMSRVAHVKRHDKQEAPAHILLARFYGLYDKHMSELNNTIVGLLKKRSQAERTREPQTILKAVEILHDLRNAIVTVLSERGYDAQGHPKA